MTRRERGTNDVAELSSDRDLVVLWMAMFRKKFSYPLGYRRDAADIAALAPATLAVLDAEAKDAAFTYRSSWRADRDDALGRSG